MAALLLSSRNASVRKSLLIKVLVISVISVIYFLHSMNQLRTPDFLHMPANSDGGEAVVLLEERVVAPIPHGNLVAQNEKVIRGPWIIESPLPAVITTKPFTIVFKCLWNADDLCPERYIVVLRGTTVYTPEIPAVITDPSDSTRVSVTIQVPEPGQYQLYAWADFGDCRKYWRENMKYPYNRGQVIGTPLNVRVTGKPVLDSTALCLMDGPENQGHSRGRWIYRGALKPAYQRSSWAKSYPDDQDYIYQPYGCKRSHSDAHVLATTKQVTHVLFMGDSVTRGSFCTQIWQKLSPSGKADGPCTYSGDVNGYHVSPKDLLYPASDGRKIRLSFRFMNHEPIQKVEGLVEVFAQVPPSHIVANIGLWLSARPIDEYRETVTKYLRFLWETYPKATIIWRTTTDVAPMIECYSEKLMYRTTMHLQNIASIEVVEKLRAEGMRIYVVDAYKITLGRPDSGNDGRHWVMEDPVWFEGTLKARPRVSEVEQAVLDTVWDLIVQDDNRREEKEQQKAKTDSES